MESSSSSGDWVVVLQPSNQLQRRGSDMFSSFTQLNRGSNVPTVELTSSGSNDVKVEDNNKHFLLRFVPSVSFIPKRMISIAKSVVNLVGFLPLISTGSGNGNNQSTAAKTPDEILDDVEFSPTVFPPAPTTGREHEGFKIIDKVSRELIDLHVVHHVNATDLIHKHHVALEKSRARLNALTDQARLHPHEFSQIAQEQNMILRTLQIEQELFVSSSLRLADRLRSDLMRSQMGVDDSLGFDNFPSRPYCSSLPAHMPSTPPSLCSSIRYSSAPPSVETGNEGSVEWHGTAASTSPYPLTDLDGAYCFAGSDRSLSTVIHVDSPCPGSKHHRGSRMYYDDDYVVEDDEGYDDCL